MNSAGIGRPSPYCVFQTYSYCRPLHLVAGAVCCCTLSVFGIIVLVAMGLMVSAGDPYVGGHHLVATAEVTKL